MKFLFLCQILMVFGSWGQELIENQTLDEWSGCIIHDDDAAAHPWLATLHVTVNSMARTKDSRSPNVYDWWPVVIVGKNLLLASGTTFRSPHSDRRIRILSNNEYEIALNTSDSQLQRLNISYIKPYPKISERHEFWMKLENDIVLIHLAEEIQFSRQIRQLCLPEEKELDVPVGESTMLSGWQCNYNYAVKGLASTFNMSTLEQQTCEEIWYNQASFSSDDVGEYVNRSCGVPSTQDEDSGFCAVKGYYNIRTTEQNKRILVGLFNGVAQEFDRGPTVYVSKLNPNTLEWINKNIKCGPFQYPCNSGDQCVDFELTCNGERDCTADGDESDEEPCYCRATHYCEWYEFACGYMGPCILKNTTKQPAECDDVCDCDACEDENQPLYSKCPVRDKGLWLWFQENWTYVIFSAIGTFFFVLAVGGTIVRKLAWKKSDLYLSPSEEFGFRQGAQWEGELEAENHATSDGEDLQQRAMQMPYIYDIEKEQVTFGTKRGEGSTAEVYEGSYGNATVILLVLNKKVCSKKKEIKETFKLLLAELKILAYVTFIKGGHRNVLKLIGACTANIRNLEITIVTEYCHWGSVWEYLKDHQSLFQNSGDQLPWPPLPINHEYVSWDALKARTAQGPPESYIAAAALQRAFTEGGQLYVRTVGHSAFLYKWIQEVIEGMCFLASHRIIHGDVAARNILLDHNLIAKIGDFGLSRQIYYYNINSTAIDRNTKLPWRWMAPEVLCSMNISIKSDVWSFGIMMWEFFTLGRLPYGGLEWSSNFVDQLRHAVRLARPQYAHPDMFAIIQSCWQLSPGARPTFDQLRDRVNELLAQPATKTELQDPDESSS